MKYAINDIGAIGQAFINILFVQLYDFRFICLIQTKTLTIVDNKVVTLGSFTYFVTT